MKTILVTGSRGWIGSYCVKILRARGHKVEEYEGNLLNPSTYPLGDALLHLAWDVNSGYWEGENNKDYFTASVGLIKDFVVNGGKRVVVAGSCADIGDTLYGRSKRALRDVLDAYRVTGLSTAYGRIFYLYGPGERRYRLIPGIINSILDEKTFIINHPSQMIDLTHVYDVARGLCDILDSNIEGSVDIGSGNPVTAIRIAQVIAEEMRHPELIESRNISSVERFACNPARLSEIGWSQKYGFQDGLRSAINWWKCEREREMAP